MIRPDGPLPETRPRSTPSSRANLRTAGPAGLIVSLGVVLLVTSPFVAATAAGVCATGFGCSTTAGSLDFNAGAGVSGSAGFSTGGAATGGAATGGEAAGGEAAGGEAAGGEAAGCDADAPRDSRACQIV